LAAKRECDRQNSQGELPRSPGKGTSMTRLRNLLLAAGIMILTAGSLAAQT